MTWASEIALTGSLVTDRLQYQLNNLRDIMHCSLITLMEAVSSSERRSAYTRLHDLLFRFENLKPHK